MVDGTARSVLKQVSSLLIGMMTLKKTQRHLTSDLHGGRGTTLTQRALKEHQCHAGLPAVRPPFARKRVSATHDKNVSRVIAPAEGWLVC